MQLQNVGVHRALRANVYIRAWCEEAKEMTWEMLKLSAEDEDEDEDQR